MGRRPRWGRRSRCTARPQKGVPSTYVLVDADIEDIGGVAGFGFEHVDPIIGSELTDRTLFVVEISEDARTDRTHLDASGQQSLGDAVITPGAFVGNVQFRVEEARGVGARLDAVLATDAIGMVDQDHAVVGLEGRAGWAHLHAGRMGAVVAQLGDEEGLLDLRVLVAVGESIGTFRTGGRDVHGVVLAVDARPVLALQIDVALDPGAEVMSVAGDLVFRLARLDAAQAADAFRGINAERPTVLAPVIARDRRHGGRGADRRSPCFLGQHGSRGYHGGATGYGGTSQTT